jgi:hypothetical protein
MIYLSGIIAYTSGMAIGATAAVILKIAVIEDERLSPLRSGFISHLFGRGS